MNKAILVILDGWGQGRIPASDAIQAAQTPFVDSLYEQYPHTTLTTFGEEVGLPEGQMGNSEVGHLNLGAGRVVYQELQRINVGVKNGSFFGNKVLLQSLQYALDNNKPLHLIGLVSDGGVHSHINHLKAIITLCHQKGLKEVYVHAFTDGRDCDPKSGLGFIKSLEEHLEQHTGKIASISGRYYAMDRDKRWERVKKAYDVLVKGQGNTCFHAVDCVKQSYDENTTDEFILPTVMVQGENREPVAVIRDGDAVLCFNFRTDRCREITEVLTQQAFPEYGMQPLQLHYTTMTEYDASFRGVHVIYEKDNLDKTLGEVVAAAGLKQIRIAETEKYPHVTFFFSGGREAAFEGESRILVPSPKVATYDLQPEMSAREITAKLLPEIDREEAAFICLNFANTDMVGHTGVFEAAIQAAETVDNCLQQVVTHALDHSYTVFVLADHGNSDYMINADGSPNTQHTTNPVPLFVIDKNWKGTLKAGKLGDIAPTILSRMGLPLPEQMTGDILMSSY